MERSTDAQRASITQTIQGSRVRDLLDGDRVRLVAWHRGDNTYWVANSLLRVLTNDQMIGIARSAKVRFLTKSRRDGGGRFERRQGDDRA
jgi:hypothetical protein